MKAADKCRMIIREGIDKEISHLNIDVEVAINGATASARLGRDRMSISHFIKGKSTEYRLAFEGRMEDEGFVVTHLVSDSLISW